jgi:hypothetical protein
MLSTFKFLDQSQTDETANWKTYDDKRYGFQFRYPPELTLDPNAVAPGSEGAVLSGVKIHLPERISSEEGGTIGIYVDSTPLDVLVAALEKSAKNKSAQAEIGGRKAKKIEWLEPLGTTGITTFNQSILFAYNNLTYEGNLFINNNSPKRDEFLKVFDQILSTFRFLPSGNSGQEE